MKKTRKDYKENRNKKIYEEYINTDTSFNKLANKYTLSPQRVRYLVNDYKKRGLGEELPLTATRKDRERYKNLAVELRENNKLTQSVQMLNQVINWDRKHKEWKLLSESLSHISVSYTKIAGITHTKKKQTEYLKKGRDYLEEVLQLYKAGKITKGKAQIAKVHLVSNIIWTNELVGERKQIKELKKALKLVNSALKDFPGSEAHKTWALNKKAQVLHRLGKSERAIEVLKESEQKLYEGYFEEFEIARKKKDKEGADQSTLKINVWLAGIHATMAVICHETGRNIMARHYANSILKIPDPEGMFGIKRRDMKKILEDL